MFRTKRYCGRKPAYRTRQIIAVYALVPLVPTSTQFTYLHGNYLGSASVVTSQSGAVVSQQQFEPEGKVRSGGTSVTDLNYTGQRKDDTGLLYYHARYYDPSLARFVSPDSIVPEASSGVEGSGGTVGDWQNSRLTVDFHETGFVSSANEENALTLQKGFWFQMNEDRGNVNPMGPSYPQALNRYAYVLNSPLVYTDPTGHCPLCKGIEIAQRIWQWITSISSRAAPVAAPIAQAARRTVPVIARTSQAGRAVLQVVQNANWTSKKISHVFQSTNPRTGINHAKDFGMMANYNSANAAAFEQILRNHVANSEIVQGAYKGTQGYHFVDRLSGLWVFTDIQGNLVAAFKLGHSQLVDLFTKGVVH